MLGGGADGDVYSIKHESNKVIKFSKLYEFHSLDPLPLDEQFANIISVLDLLIKNDNKLFAKVFEYKYLGTFDRDQVYYPNNIESKRKQKFILYYYVMEKLQPLSDDEKRVFHSLLSHEDRGLKKDLSSQRIESMVYGMSKSLDFDKLKVIYFCNHISNMIIHHNDLHPRNIMKDNCGNFKLIDFDRSFIK